MKCKRCQQLGTLCNSCWSRQQEAAAQSSIGLTAEEAIRIAAVLNQAGER